MFAEPASRVFVLGACVSDKAPEVPRVVEPPQVHQLMNQHIIADMVGHQHESPIQADVTRGRTRAPARSLIPNADARDVEAVVPGKAQQALRKLERGLPAQARDRLGRVTRSLCCTFAHALPLALDPGTLFLGEQLGLAAGSPSWNGDAHAAIGAHADDISPGRRMADEIHERTTIVLRHGS